MLLAYMFALSVSTEDHRYDIYPHAMYTGITKNKFKTDTVKFRVFAFVYFKHEGFLTC